MTAKSKIIGKQGEVALRSNDHLKKKTGTCIHVLAESRKKFNRCRLKSILGKIQTRILIFHNYVW